MAKYDIFAHPYDGGAPINVGSLMSDEPLRVAIGKICLIILGFRPVLDLDHRIEVSTDNPEWANPYRATVAEYIPVVLHDKHPKSGVKP